VDTARRQRATRIGRFVAVAHADPGAVEDSAARLSSRGYRARRTAHFVCCQRRAEGDLVVLHTFDEAMVDEDLSPLVGEELGALGVLRSPADYGDALFAVVASTCPRSLDCPECGHLHLDPEVVWRRFVVNTLARVGALMSAPRAPGGSHLALFAAVYGRIAELRVGARLLDVGTNFGVLPMLLCERAGDLEAVGCDIRSDVVACASEVARVAGAGRASFRVADVLAPDFAAIGRFDTVTAVHVLEHLTDDELPVALRHLLAVTGRRLILSVPYEPALRPQYGHLQRFTPERLPTLGTWCVEALGGGAFLCEDVGGGFLVVDRPG
jgi:SAM-dependent methyltransferase